MQSIFSISKIEFPLGLINLKIVTLNLFIEEFSNTLVIGLIYSVLLTALGMPLYEQRYNKSKDKILRVPV